MTYKLIITDQANEEVAEAYLWLLERTEHAHAWHDRVEKSIQSLANMPSRCPLAPEYRKKGSKDEVRHLIVGDRIHTYRIIYVIRDETVTVLRVIHGARNIYAL